MNAMRIVVMSIAGVLFALSLVAAIFVAANWAPERSVAELQARWAPPPSTFLDVAGMKVHVRDEGPRDDKSPIVLAAWNRFLPSRLGGLGAGAERQEARDPL